jgi:hypothetical protein
MNIVAVCVLVIHQLVQVQSIGCGLTISDSRGTTSNDLAPGTVLEVPDQVEEASRLPRALYYDILHVVPQVTFHALCRRIRVSPLHIAVLFVTPTAG